MSSAVSVLFRDNPLALRDEEIRTKSRPAKTSSIHGCSRVSMKAKGLRDAAVGDSTARRTGSTGRVEPLAVNDRAGHRSDLIADYDDDRQQSQRMKLV